MKKYWPLLIPVGLVALALFVYVGGLIVQSLWNWLAPALFGLPVISFWQAFGLLVLCRILFGGFGMSGGGKSSPRCKGDHRGDRQADRMADRFAERWERMTPEQRERFRGRVRERTGFDPTASETPEA